jgi:hypothetical protein
MKKDCCTPGRAVRYDGWHGTHHEFYVVSKDYTVKLMQANRGKLVNVSPEAQALLAEPVSVPPRPVPSGYSIAPAYTPPPVYTPQPAHVPSVQSDEWLFGYSLKKIQAQKNASDRRISLQAALGMFKGDEYKHRLTLEASRIETQLVLDRVATLKTTSGKRRALQTVIDEIKADQLSDDMQADLLRQLEDELDKLDAAGAVAVQQQTAPSQADAAARLRQLDSLMQRGLITDDEYAAQRKVILGNI